MLQWYLTLLDMLQDGGAVYSAQQITIDDSNFMGNIAQPVSFIVLLCSAMLKCYMSGVWRSSARAS